MRSLQDETPLMPNSAKNGKGDPLLGRDTATSLGVLKIGIDIAAVDTSR